jgi:hypothetical protein
MRLLRFSRAPLFTRQQSHHVAHQGFTGKKQDFIINCDIKYGMGQDSRFW